MGTFDSSSIDADKILDSHLNAEPPNKVPTAGKFHGPNIEDVRRTQEQNRERLSGFADLMPAEPSEDIHDPDRALLETIKKSPEKYQSLLDSVEDTEREPEQAPVPRDERKQSGFQALLKRLGLGKKTNPYIEQWMEILERPISRPIVIGVTSFKGGCGKTTLSSMLSTVLKRARPDDHIVAVDMDPSGNLANRAKGKQQADIQDYIRSIRTGSLDPSPFTLETPDGVDILGSRLSAVDKEPSPREVVGALECLEDYYDIVVVDMPHRSSTKSYAALLHMLDVVVFVFEAKNDAIASVYDVMPVLEDAQCKYLTSRLVVAFNHTAIVGSKTAEFDSNDVVEDLIDMQVETLILPYDDHLRDAGVLDGMALPERKYQQFVQLGAQVINSVEENRTQAKLSVRS